MLLHDNLNLTILIMLISERWKFSKGSNLFGFLNNNIKARITFFQLDYNAILYLNLSSRLINKPALMSEWNPISNPEMA